MSSMAEASVKALQSSLSKLQIAQSSPIPIAKAKNKAGPADSWEDEADDDESSDTETESTTPIRSADDAPAPPPPTPSSPSMGVQYLSERSPYRTFPPSGLDGGLDSSTSSGASTPSRRGEQLRPLDEKRPEKSTAVASRLIAAGIGQKAPRRTKEEREYDQAMKIQEKKRRDGVKEEEARKVAAKEKALKDIWDG